MIVSDFDLVCVPGHPDKADPPLIVNANTVLTLAASAQFLQTIRWRNTQIIQVYGIIQHAQFPQRNLLNIPRKSQRTLPGIYLPGFPVFK
jgi:hypothetical protein